MVLTGFTAWWGKDMLGNKTARLKKGDVIKCLKRDAANLGVINVSGSCD